MPNRKKYLREQMEKTTLEYMRCEDELLSGLLNRVEMKQLLVKMADLNVDYYLFEKEYQEKYGPINPEHQAEWERDHKKRNRWWRRRK